MNDKTDREIMQQALNDLEALVAYIKGGEPDLFMQVPSIEALSERLAQPEPLQRLTDVQQEIEAALLEAKVRADEREACAKVIEDECHDDMTRAEEAAAIRARGEK